MFQLAHAKQRRIDINAKAPAFERGPAIAPGKQALTAQLESRHLGAPDYYTRAIESATRELAAIRTTALPAFVAVRRKQDLAPLAKQIELARSAMQVRHMLLTANAHVYALEQAATHTDPMVVHLRTKLEQLVAIATKVGVYRDAEDMKPRAYVEPKARPAGGLRHNVTHKPTHEAPAAPASTLDSGAPAQITKRAGNTPPPARPRLARGTSAPGEQAASTHPTTPTPTTATSRVRPGFRPGARF